MTTEIKALSEQEQKLRLGQIRIKALGYSWISPVEKMIINEIFDYLLGLNPYPNRIISASLSSYCLPSEINEVVNIPDTFTGVDDRIINLITNHWDIGQYVIIVYFVRNLPHEGDLDLMTIWSSKLSEFNTTIPQIEILSRLLYEGGDVLISKNQLTSGGKFVKEQILSNFKNSYQFYNKKHVQHKEDIFWYFLFFVDEKYAEQYIDIFFNSTCKVNEKIGVYEFLLTVRNTVLIMPPFLD